MSIPFSAAAQNEPLRAQKIILCDFFTAFVKLAQPESEIRDLRAALIAAVDAGHKVRLTSFIDIDDAFKVLADINLRHQFPGQNALEKLMHDGRIAITHGELQDVFTHGFADIYINRESGHPVGEGSGVKHRHFILSQGGRAGAALRQELGLGGPEPVPGPAVSPL